MQCTNILVFLFPKTNPSAILVTISIIDSPFIDISSGIYLRTSAKPNNKKLIWS